MILPRKVLKIVNESNHPCRTATVVLNQRFPVLPFNKNALCALAYIFPMPLMILALMLHFLIVAHKALCHTHPVNGLLEAYKDTVEVLLMLMQFSQRIRKLNICSVAPSRSENNI